MRIEKIGPFFSDGIGIALSVSGLCDTEIVVRPNDLCNIETTELVDALVAYELKDFDPAPNL